MANIEELKIALPENLENLELPSPESYNYWNLADRRIFYLDFGIDTSVLEIQKQILNINLQDKEFDVPVEKRIPIKILIDSSGGWLSEAVSLSTTIKLSKTPVITINMAEASSAACAVLCSGHKRYALENSYAMIHSGSISDYSGTFEQTEAFGKFYKKQVNRMKQFIVSRTNITQSQMTKKSGTDWYFDDEEQVKYGIVDKIIDDIDDIIW